jgi:rod shape-determining protein MreC
MLATAARSTVLSPVLRLQRGFSDMRLIRGRVQDLRFERDSLKAQLLALQNVEEENLRLRALVGLTERGKNQFAPANLFPAGRTGQIVARSFRLDLGADDGVKPDAPVIAPEGLVGVVRVTSGGQALGDFWTHPEFRVSAMTTDGRVFGIIRPLGESPLLMQLDGAPYQLELAAGTELVTSGMGGVFPRGIPIGRVTRLMSAEEGWARSYEVQPSTYPEAAVEVMVLIERDEAGDLEDAWNQAATDSRQGQ